MTLERRTPLRTNLDKARAWEQRSRKPLPAQGAKAKRERRALAAFRKALLMRSGGLCEVATPDCPPGPHAGQDPHHVYPADRDRGVHDPARGLWVCRAGHDWIGTKGVATGESYRRGWLGRG